jgi:hypothetical protein
VEELIGGWRKLYNEELHNLYSSLNMRVIKSKWMKWEGPAARMKRNANRDMERRFKREHSQNLCPDENVMLKFV